MSAATLEAPAPVAFGNPVLTRAVCTALEKAVGMCNAPARCVGLTIAPCRDVGTVTGVIGVSGKASGFVTVNLAERAALKLVGGLLQDQFDRLTCQVIDGAGELANLVAGGVKSQLAGTPWSFSQMTVPSVIVGRGYHISYARGLDYCSATFELQDEEALMLDDRLVQVCLNLLRV